MMALLQGQINYSRSEEYRSRGRLQYGLICPLQRLCCWSKVFTVKATRDRLRVLDLFSGAGGFSEGFRQAGFDIVGGVDNWPPARRTHKWNGLGDSYNHNMMQLIDEDGYEKAKARTKEIEDKHGRIDVLIGSPPCTEFSYAKNGGNGDIEEGMLLVRAFLVFAAALKPRFWIFENIPRLEKAIELESVGHSSRTWRISLERLGIREDISDWVWIDGEYLLVPRGGVLTSSDYGSPQQRRRYIAGHFGLKHLNRQKREGQTLGQCLEKLNSALKAGRRTIRDPNYPHHSIRFENLRDHCYGTKIHPMYWEHMRHLKRRHIQYGRMSFPDSLHKPSRTIMATLNSASREAVVIDTGETRRYQGKQRPTYRQITVREAACLQGFPLDYQLVGNSLNTRYRLVGNAVPCQLANALALAVLDELEGEGCDDDEQKSRHLETQRHRKAHNLLPIIVPAARIVDETNAIGNEAFMEFRARGRRHIRRKIPSSKIAGRSAVVVIENTIWDGNRRHGGFWKSCLQIGVGSVFHQVYLDSHSINIILKEIDDNQDLREGALTLRKPLAEIKAVVSNILSEIKNGLPLVHKDWTEFPGYRSTDTRTYSKLVGRKTCRIPSASMFQKMFTTDMKRIGSCIGPLDLFDGIDALMLKNLVLADRNWVLDVKIPVKNLRDSGKELHVRRISERARSRFTGAIPLVTLIASMVSVGLVHEMHIQDGPSDNPLFKSIALGHKTILKWCG